MGEERVAAMDWVWADSRAFAEVAYDNDKHQLYIRFHSGKVYRYFGFPHHQYDELLAAESRGTYFAEQIRGRFAYEQAVEPRLGPGLVYSSGK
jgi:hypothetical protein